MSVFASYGNGKLDDLIHDLHCIRRRSEHKQNETFWRIFEIFTAGRHKDFLRFNGRAHLIEKIDFFLGEMSEEEQVRYCDGFTTWYIGSGRCRADRKRAAWAKDILKVLPCLPGFLWAFRGKEENNWGNNGNWFNSHPPRLDNELLSARDMKREKKLMDDMAKDPRP